MHKTTISVTTVNAETGTTVLVGLYKDGLFIDITTAVYNGESITVKTTKQFDNIKVMMWKDLKSLTPICQSENL